MVVLVVVSVTYDTVIPSTIHLQTARGSTTLGVNCNGLNCRASNGNNLDLSLSLKLFDKLQRNGRVNGPHEESGTATVNGVTSNITDYSYWMGDSVFGVSNESGFINGLHTKVQSAGVMGNDTGSRPRGNATYTGKAIAIYVSDDDILGYNTGDVEYGDFYATYNYGENFINVDLEFDEWVHDFDSATVNSDGSFRVNESDEKLNGNFFGSGHREVAGTYEILDVDGSVVGSFGGIKD